MSRRRGPVNVNVARSKAFDKEVPSINNIVYINVNGSTRVTELPMYVCIFYTLKAVWYE